MRSVFAVIAGFFFTAFISTFVDRVLEYVGILPPNQPLTNGTALLATIYRTGITVVGAWLTARIAPRNPMRHALILGAIGTAVGILGVVVTWNMGLGPRWYGITLAVLGIPQCWLGAKIFESMVNPRERVGRPSPPSA